jgi:hypothetical protein
VSPPMTWQQGVRRASDRVRTRVLSVVSRFISTTGLRRLATIGAKCEAGATTEEVPTT